MKKVALIGLGRIGMGYDASAVGDEPVFSHARAFALHPAFELVAGVDGDPGKRAEFRGRFGCAVYGGVAEALERHAPDLVVIAVPTEAHAAVLTEVLRVASPEVILCEKPLAFEIDRARQMLAACAERGVRLYVNYMRRSDPGVREVHRRIEAGEVPAPLKGTAWYSKGFLHNGSHIFNLLELWLGAMEGFHLIDSGRMWDGHDPEPDVQVRFERGSVIFLAAWEESFSHYTVELLCSAGRLRYEREGALIEWSPARADEQFAGYTVLSAEPEAIPSGTQVYQWHVADQLARELAGETFQLCSGAEALGTLESMHRIVAER